MMGTPAMCSVFAWALGEKLKNWAGNLEYSTQRLDSANSSQQVIEFVTRQAKLKVLGTRHCFNNIADSKDYFLSVKAMDRVVSVDPEAHTVTVEAGATYGSGDGNGNLSTAVSGIEFVAASGDVVNLSRQRHGETFNAAVVGLGALGVITKLTLDVQPRYMMRQYVYENLPFSELKQHFDAIM